MHGCMYSMDGCMRACSMYGMHVWHVYVHCVYVRDGFDVCLRARNVCAYVYICIRISMYVMYACMHVCIPSCDVCMYACMHVLNECTHVCM